MSHVVTWQNQVRPCYVVSSTLGDPMKLVTKRSQETTKPLAERFLMRLLIAIDPKTAKRPDSLMSQNGSSLEVR